MMKMKEEWKSVDGFEGYLVSNTGKVLSLRFGKVRLLKVDKSSTYCRVTLSRGNKKYREYVHVLVAKLFIENPKGKPFVNHIDGNKENCYSSNLEWCTRSENEVHALSTGLKGRGSKRYNSKRTDNQVHEVCDLISKGVKRRDILKSCPYMTLRGFNHIRNRDQWTHISKHYNW